MNEKPITKKDFENYEQQFKDLLTRINVKIPAAYQESKRELKKLYEEESKNNLDRPEEAKNGNP